MIHVKNPNTESDLHKSQINIHITNKLGTNTGVHPKRPHIKMATD